MAQIEVTGLAEVLADHEDKIAAAQAWCVQQNIRSIEELREKGDAAVDEFIGAAGIGEFLPQFIVKRRIGEYDSVMQVEADAAAPKTPTARGLQQAVEKQRMKWFAAASGGLAGVCLLLIAVEFVQRGMA